MAFYASTYAAFSSSSLPWQCKGAQSFEGPNVAGISAVLITAYVGKQLWPAAAKMQKFQRRGKVDAAAGKVSLAGP